MASTGTESKVTRSARIVLVDGDDVFGCVHSPSPELDELLVEGIGRTNGAGAARHLPIDSVAYIAYRDSSAPSTREDRDRRVPVRVYLSHARTILAEPITNPEDPFGFHAILLDGDSEEIFFFAHAVDRIERDEPIGAMLIQAEALHDTDLEAGLGHQARFPRRRVGEILLSQNRIEEGELSQALDLQERKHVRIGEVLIGAGLATHGDVEAALAEQRRSGRHRIGQILVDMGIIEERALAMTLARKFHLPFVDLDTCLVNPDATRVIPRWIMERHHVLPIEIGEDEITLALSDPIDTEVIDLVRFQGHGKIREVVAPASQVKKYLDEFLSKECATAGRTRLEELLGDPVIDLTTTVDAETDSEGFEIRESDGAVIQLANQMIVEAIERDASDIHIEPDSVSRGVGIRFRVDGECVALPIVPAGYGKALISRFKIMAKLDIAEQRKPQDGRIRIRLPHRSVELRVATIPTLAGEDVVLRILPDAGPMALEEMGLSERNRQVIEQLISRTHGLLLCVGPTGSGKTTSLHSLLGHINVPERKIWTAEDPIEISQPGLRQVEVHPKIGFGFAQALRAFLRADPDVIMIGEMRDAETAEIAVHASLTGHLVMSTLHTNSAPETAVRMAQMGLDPFSFSDALLGILAQRLVRRLCQTCRSLEPAQGSDRAALQSALDRDHSSEGTGNLLWTARGCDACRGSGYRGRVAIHELLEMNEPLRVAIQQGASADRIRQIAIDGGMMTIFQDGLGKCLKGETDLQQVRAVCGFDRVVSADIEAVV